VTWFSGLVNKQTGGSTRRFAISRTSSRTTRRARKRQFDFGKTTSRSMSWPTLMERAKQERVRSARPSAKGCCCSASWFEKTSFWTRGLSAHYNLALILRSSATRSARRGTRALHTLQAGRQRPRHHGRPAPSAQSRRQSRCGGCRDLRLAARGRYLADVGPILKPVVSIAANAADEQPPPPPLRGRPTNTSMRTTAASASRSAVRSGSSGRCAGGAASVSRDAPAAAGGTVHEAKVQAPARPSAPPSPRPPPLYRRHRCLGIDFVHHNGAYGRSCCPKRWRRRRGHRCGQ